MEHAVLHYRDLGRQCALQPAMSCPTSISKNPFFRPMRSSIASSNRWRGTCCPGSYGDGCLTNSASKWMNRCKGRAEAFLAHCELSSSVRSLSPPLATKLRSGAGDRPGYWNQIIYRGDRRVRVSKTFSSPDEEIDGADDIAPSYSEFTEQEVDQPLFNAGGIPVSRQLLWTITAAALTIFFSVSNKILYKMALVPMGRFPFFMAQLTTFGYVGVYFTILYLRYRAGIVTNEMLKLPKGRLAAIGGLEALALSSGMASAAVLPGAAIPILNQVFLVWQLLLSYSFLGKRYTPAQLWGCLLVIFGVVIVVASGNGGGPALEQLPVSWSMLMILSTGFSAAANILKEAVFQDAKKQIKGGVDIFVVNSFGSGFQALFVLLLLPFLSNLRGIPFKQLPAYMKEGAACFFNAGSSITACDGAPLVPLLYILFNLSFNVAALNLLKMTSAIVASLVMTLAVPAGVWGFTWNLPYLGPPSKLPPGLWLGATVLVCGLAVYNIASQTKKSKTV